MQNNEFLIFFHPLFINSVSFASVRLGSDTTLNIPLNTVPAALFSKKKPKGKNYHEAPPPVTITEVDGVEIKVERLPIRYEKLDDIYDELPDFAQELLADRVGISDSK